MDDHDDDEKFEDIESVSIGPPKDSTDMEDITANELDPMSEEFDIKKYELTVDSLSKEENGLSNDSNIFFFLMNYLHLYYLPPKKFPSESLFVTICMNSNFVFLRSWKKQCRQNAAFTTTM